MEAHRFIKKVKNKLTDIKQKGNVLTNGANMLWQFFRFVFTSQTKLFESVKQKKITS